MAKPQLGFVLLLFLCLIFVDFEFAWCQSEDTDVMKTLNDSIKGNNKPDWSDSDVCNWKGVQCGSMKKVTAIKIGNLQLEGTLPEELSQLSELTTFECMGNRFYGRVPRMPTSLQNLYISNNNFNSTADDFFKNMSNLQDVRIDYNPFSQWQLPISLKDCVSLEKFSAMNTSLVGQIPEFFGSNGPFTALTYLALCFNKFEGALPASFAASSIQKLLLNGQMGTNKLNGTLSVLQNMTSLTQIWVHGNAFTGPIPDLSNHDQLDDVSLRDNQLTGVVPVSLVNLPNLTVVNLTNNYLQGSPPKFNDSVRVDNDMDRGRNSFCTKVVGKPCSPLVNALLSVVQPLGYPLKFATSWQGNDPCTNDAEWLGIVCSGGNISTINFQNMGLSGTISPSFATLTSVTVLNLRNNNLTGTIPKEIASMPLLKKLDVSNNNLYGKVPSFRAGIEVNTTGNPDIGKDALQGEASGGSKKLGAGAIAGIVVGIVCLLGLGILGYVMYGRRHKHVGKVQSPNAIVVHPRHSGDGNRLKMSVAAGSSGTGVGGTSTSSAFSTSSSAQNGDGGNMVISIQILREVTNNFSKKNILGKGGFGTVYKGVLHDGTMIAVKRMESAMVGESEKGLSEFKSEIAVLTKVRHRHLVALMGYCLDENEKLLVYEYMPQGPLSKHLFEWKDEGLKPLDWKRRLSIALDVARGVEYLHGLAQQIFIHRDLKPSNILLGDDMRAKVSDFGLVRLAPEGQTSFETRLAGTFGYLAPEYAVTGRVTTKVDVYSFGVILMEMISGRRAIDNRQPDENIHLVTWFRRMLLNKESFQKLIDPTIDVDEEAMESFKTVAELAGHCTSREPNQRPDMGHVVNVLAPLVEIWKPSEPDDDDPYGFDMGLSLTQAVSKWQAAEGRSNFDLSTSSSVLGAENTQSSIPPHDGFAVSFKSNDAR